MNNNQQHLEAAIGTLRQCGFFESFSGQTDSQVAIALLSNLQEYSKDNQSLREFYQRYPELTPDNALLVRFSEPADADSYKELAAHDSTRVWSGDMEADVCEGNRVYEQLVGEYAKLSLGYLKLTNIVETWLSETGPVTLNFEHQGRQFTVELPYYDDWIAGEVFTSLDEIMLGEGFPATIQTEANTGQDVFLVRADEAEIIKMKQLLGWSFEWPSIENDN